jgi:hypothetical protein
MLPNIVPEVERWLADHHQPLLTVETRVSHVHAGASGVGAELIVVVIGCATTLTLHELWGSSRVGFSASVTRLGGKPIGIGAEIGRSCRSTRL